MKQHLRLAVHDAFVGVPSWDNVSSTALCRSAMPPNHLLMPDSWELLPDSALDSEADHACLTQSGRVFGPLGILCFLAGVDLFSLRWYWKA